MKTLAAAIAATMLLIAPISAPSRALAGVPAGNLRTAVPQTENASIQEVNKLVKQFDQVRKMVKAMSGGKGKMRLPGGMKLPPGMGF